MEKLGDNWREFIKLFTSQIKKRKDSDLVKGGLGSFLLKFGHTLLGFVLSVILARFLGAEAFGIYTYVFAIISVMAVPTRLGLPHLLVRYIAKYQIKKEWRKIKGLLRASNAIVILVSLVLILGSLLVINYEIVSIGQEKLSTFYWGLALLPVIALASIRGASLRGLRYIVLGLAPERVIKHIVFILLLVLSWWFLPESLTSEIAMKFHVIAALSAYLIGAYWLLKKLPKEVKKSLPEYRIKEWTIVALPLLLNSGMHIINNKIDVIFLGSMATPEEVGIYEICWKGGLLIAFGLNALNMLLGPYFSRYYNSNQIERLQKIATLSVVFNSFLGGGILIVFILFGNELLGVIFGGEFTAGYTTFVILCFANFVNVVSGSVVTLLNMTGHEKKVLIGLTMAAVLNIFLNLSLIPKYGMEGAAIASLCTFLIWNTFLITVSIKKIGINTSIFSVKNYLR